MVWVTRVVALAALVVVAWALITGWGGVIHGYPLYLGFLIVTVLVALVFGIRSLRRRQPRRRVLRVILLVLAVGWVALVAWLRPFSATEPAIAAMQSGDGVSVSETPSEIVLSPTGTVGRTAVFFQPGAKVDARAYAAVLRPVARAGYRVVIAKQPLDIAFLAVSAFDSAKSQFPGVTRWVIGGHSLGGTVAAMEADSGDAASAAPVVGLFLYASYPANNISSSLTARVLSVSGSRDGLATPVAIRASKSSLPADTDYVVIAGGVHAFFADYGPQPGDGTPTISHSAARTQISSATVAFVRSLAAG